MLNRLNNKFKIHLSLDNKEIKKKESPFNMIKGSFDKTCTNINKRSTLIKTSIILFDNSHLQLA